MLRVFVQRSLRMSTSDQVRNASTAVFASKFGLKDPSLVKSTGLINGKWNSGKSKETFAVLNPATNEEIGTLPEMDVAAARECIDAAAEAFKLWSTTTAKVRHDALKRMYDLMLENSDDIARITTLENGKPLSEAKGEATYSASFIEWFAEESLRTYGEVIPNAISNLRSVVIKQAIGPVFIATPWNFPSAMIARKLGPALAAGCTVVIKPATETPFSALALAELASRAGIPNGVINIITTSKYTNEVSKECCESPAIRKVSFTGSTRVAKILAGYSVSTLKKLSIEAGGNAPFIVFNDADVDAAVEGAIICKFRHTGQTCVCANRIFVQSNVYDEFASKLSARVEGFVVGDGLHETTTHGPLIHDRAVKKVHEHVQDAVGRGASVLAGGEYLQDKGPNFYAPTVLADVPYDALLHSEETFGPVAALTKFDTEEEVLALANNTEYGLAGYFFSQDVGRVWRVAERLEVGMVGANTGVISQATIPFGGVKESGYGREGHKGIEEYLITKYIAFGGV